MYDLLANFNPLEVGNLATVSAWENDQEAKVHQLLDYFNDDRWVYITSRDMDRAIDLFGIDYILLPQYLKDLIDTIDIIQI